MKKVILGENKSPRSLLHRLMEKLESIELAQNSILQHLEMTEKKETTEEI